MEIFVIAGHGAGDPGKCANGYQEAERVRALAAKIKQYGGDKVTLADTSRNWYEDNGISALTIPTTTQIIELHMDSAKETAKGGHVIIYGAYKADAYDKALAEVLKKYLPGRAQMIVGRTDLANPKRAAAKGYPYRMLEVGFITNKNDLAVFNSRMDDIAKDILQAFGIFQSDGKQAAAGVGQSGSYLVKVTTGALNVRDGAGTNYKVNTVIRDQGTYTIVETVGNWGRLKSGAGWICLDYTKKV